MKTPWEILEIPQSATPEEIKAAYRKLAKDNHPDVGGDHDKFLEIKQAYETLTAPQQSNNHNSNKTLTSFSRAVVLLKCGMLICHNISCTGSSIKP